MHVQKAVITAASPSQRALPLQKLIDIDGEERSVLRLIIGYAHSAAIQDICVVVHPGDEQAYADAAGVDGRHLCFVTQERRRGYGAAVHCAREFTQSQPFLHLVSDHIYVSPDGPSFARSIVEAAEKDQCSVSAVQATRETAIGNYGVVGGPRIPGKAPAYRVEAVIEKPTPTEAEQKLVVTGVRSGFYLAFFGVHVLTPTIFEILDEKLNTADGHVTLSDALAEIARREQYIALVTNARRYDLGGRYGFLTAQLALAMHGRDQSDVLSRLLDVIASERKDGSANVE